jgi:hypothetical protein
MSATTAPSRRLLPPLAALLAVCLAACAAPGSSIIERLDPATGTTIVRSGQAAVFARGEPGYSRSARDYLYIGPVETDRQGVREYYLWVGIGTTLDRGFIVPGTGRPRNLFLRVRGEWMQLPLESLSVLRAGSSAGRLYRTAVKAREELAARVTLNQLELMEDDALQSVRVADASGRTSLYLRWRDAPAWPDFVAYAQGKRGDATAPPAASGGGAIRGRAKRRASNEP